MDGIPAEQQAPPSAESASTETRLKGHLGHLTKEEDTALEEFKALSIKAGFYTPETEKTKASHDDGTLIRYLRARKFVPQDAFAQFKDTEIWRKENDLNALYEKIDIRDYWEARSVYPQWTGRRDKRGIPVYLYEVGRLDSKKMAAYASATSKAKSKGPSPSKMLRLFALYENLTRFVMPLCSAVPGRPNPETPVDQSNNIVDISRVGLKQFWNLRSHMQDASQLATAHYPETLDRIFIIGAPSFFPTVWGWIKKWFDPITTSKIFILSHNQVLPTLSSFIDIANIPKKYGGELDFECGKMPVLDQQVRDCLSIKAGSDTEKLFLTAPVRWIDAGDDGEMTAVSVGSLDGKQRKDPVATLHSLAVRVMTSSSRHTQRSQVVDTAGAPASRPPSYHNRDQQAALSTRPLSKGQLSPQSRSSSYQKPTIPSSSSPLQPAPAANFTTPPPPHQKDPTTIAPASQSSESVKLNSDPNPKAPPSVPSKQAPPEDAIKDLHITQNGGPPEPQKKISIPPPPHPIERQETVYMTPATEPSEIPKNLDSS
ncbi:hypothetical protein ACLMJK_001149 [Lecanora helva]